MEDNSGGALGGKSENKQRWRWSDGWILATLFVADEPIDRKRLIALADGINHAILTENEIRGAMSRLSKVGFAMQQGDHFTISDPGKVIRIALFRGGRGRNPVASR